MVKNEAHFISSAIDPAYTSAKCGNQITHRLKQHIGQHSPFEVSPQPFDKVQTRTIRWQPEYLNETSVGPEPFPNRPCMVKSSVVAHQPDFSSSISFDQHNQKSQEVVSALGRSTRETELVEQWPEHVVCAWIGNSKAVAREHYLQVTEEHFERAAGTFVSDVGATQNPTQQNAETSFKASQTVGQSAKFDSKRGLVVQCEGELGRGGFEPP